MRLRSLGPYLLLLLPAVALVVFVDRFPSPMPVHWDAAGRPNGFFPRTPLAMAFPPLRAIAKTPKGFSAAVAATRQAMRT